MNDDSKHSRALQWVVSSGNVDRVFNEVKARLGHRRIRKLRRVGIALASLALLIAAGSDAHFHRPAPALSPSAALSATRSVASGIESPPIPATEASPSRPAMVAVTLPPRQILPDGSVVDMRPGASIEVHFAQGDSGLRRVDLRSGEATFKVAHNPKRAFIVNASGVEVRAIGTTFAVELEPARIEVLVTEGKVQVALPVSRTGGAASSPGAAFVAAGQCMLIPMRSGSPIASAPLQTFAASGSELHQGLAWGIPRVTFSGTHLSEAIPLFNRYARAHLRIGDSAIDDLELSGILRADNTEALLRLLKDQFGVSADSNSSGEIVLHR